MRSQKSTIGALSALVNDVRTYFSTISLIEKERYEFALFVK